MSTGPCYVIPSIGRVSRSSPTEVVDLHEEGEMVTSSVIAKPDDQVLRVILGIEPKKKPKRRKTSKVKRPRRKR